MSSPALEAFLARLYTDAELLQHFLSDPEPEARRAGLCDQEVAALGAIDRAGLQMAADSYAHKRKRHQRVRKPLRIWLLHLLRWKR